LAAGADLTTLRRVTALGWLRLGCGLALVACLDELPAPTSCPAPAKIPAGDCLPVLDSKPLFGQCYDASQLGCLLGKRSGCECVPNECPELPEACYPAEDCPAAVRALQGAEQARCVRVPASQLDVVPENLLTCRCGCAACSSVCDGAGPTFAFDVPMDGMLTPFIIDLDGLLPERGRGGVYLRMRGSAAVFVVFGRGKLDDWDSFTLFEPPFVVVEPLTTSFVERPLFFQQANGWKSAGEKPSHLLIASQAAGAAAKGMFEIDCVVPFVVPLE
jgi:hypothetical protein